MKSTVIFTILLALVLCSAQESPLRTTRKASAAALKKIKQFYPKALVDTTYVKRVTAALNKRGFNNFNTIALVGTCRDEINRPLVNLIEKSFGPSFTLSGLGGLYTGGKIGFGAAFSHSPETGKSKRQKYVFFSYPHIGVSETGKVGKCKRPGIASESSACGALIAVQGLAKAKVPVSKVVEAEDVEFSILKQKVLVHPAVKNAGKNGPSLVTVTNATMQTLNRDLYKYIAKTVDISKADYAVITGIQINTGAQQKGKPFTWSKAMDYISPGTMYSVVQGKKLKITL